MSKNTNSLSRRQFLKGAAYTSALSVGGLSSLAFADSSTVTLLNQSNKAVVLDAAQPVSLKKVPGWVVVKLNVSPEQGSAETNDTRSITLAAGQQRSFTVDSDLVPSLKEAGGHIVITSEQAVFDKMVPMATFDVLVV